MQKMCLTGELGGGRWREQEPVNKSPEKSGVGGQGQPKPGVLPRPVRCLFTVLSHWGSQNLKQLNSSPLG